MKNLLRMSDLSPAELTHILDVADQLKAQQKLGGTAPLLAGKTVALMFSKASTRTRTSFEVGVYQMGGLGNYMNTAELQAGRGEPLRDTARVLGRYYDCAVWRTYRQRDLEELAELSGGEPEGGWLRFAYDFARRQLFPAGRLDKTSTGFVLLTDDGTFAHDILAPKRHVSKTYTVVLDTPLTEQMRTGFAAGVTLADGTALSPAEVTALSADGCTVRVVLKQGVYHQIKRMFGVYGAGVNGLHRDAIGGLALDPALAPGQWRELSAEEVSKISS